MLKVNNKGARCLSGVFIVNFEYISHLFLVFLLSALKYLIAGWDPSLMKVIIVWLHNFALYEK